MPVYLRKFYHKKLIDLKKEEKKEIDKINNKNLRYKIPHNFSKHLSGEKIFKIARRSKYLIFH